MKIRMYLCLLCFFALTDLKAETETDRQLWLAFFQQARISKHAGYWIDIHHRTKNEFVQNFNANLFRFGVTYYITNQARVTVGYAYILHFPLVEHQSFFKQEHRPWQMVQHGYKNKVLNLVGAFRAEERFIQKSKGKTILPGFDFRLRFRFNILFNYKLNRKPLPFGNILLVLNNEAMVNGYSSDGFSVFDQNRAFAGLGFQVTETFQVQAGYMHFYFATAKGYTHAHTPRIFFIHTPDFRKNR